MLNNVILKVLLFGFFVFCFCEGECDVFGMEKSCRDLNDEDLIVSRNYYMSEIEKYKNEKSDLAMKTVANCKEELDGIEQELGRRGGEIERIGASGGFEGKNEHDKAMRDIGKLSDGIDFIESLGSVYLNRKRLDDGEDSVFTRKELAEQEEAIEKKLQSNGLGGIEIIRKMARESCSELISANGNVFVGGGEKRKDDDRESMDEADKVIGFKSVKKVGMDSEVGEIYVREDGMFEGGMHERNSEVDGIGIRDVGFHECHLLKKCQKLQRKNVELEKKVKSIEDLLRRYEVLNSTLRMEKEEYRMKLCGVEFMVVSVLNDFLILPVVVKDRLCCLGDKLLNLNLNEIISFTYSIGDKHRMNVILRDGSEWSLVRDSLLDTWIWEKRES